MKVPSLHALVVALSLAPLSAQQPSTPEQITAFAVSLETCAAAKASMPHPLVPSFTVEHTIAGLDAGACGYRQTMPGNMVMVCAMSEEGRKGLATELRTMVTSRSVRGGTSATQPTWMKECQIELPDGKRIPAVTPPRN